MAMAAAIVPERIRSAQVPELPTASWSNAWRIGDELVMSGMTAHPATREGAQMGRPLSAYEQTLVVLGKLEALVKAAGGDRRHIVKTVVYVTDIADKDEVGRARRDFFQDAYPCSTLVAVSALVFPELRVEVDAWARLDAPLPGAVPQSPAAA